MTAPTRRSLVLAAVAAVVVTSLTGCDDAPPPVSIRLADPRGTTVAPSGDDAVTVSRYLFERASAVVFVPADDADRAQAGIRLAQRLRVPALPDTTAGRAEAERLGARAVTRADQVTGAGPTTSRAVAPTIALTSAASPTVTQLAAVGDATVTRIRPDPRKDAASIAALRANPDGPLLAIGARAYPVRVVRSGATTIAGGYLALPGHHYVAMYGHPAGGSLGVLGEQGPKASVARVRALVRKYRRAAPDVAFAPAFEIIATVASGSKGPRGDYSLRTSVDDLRPLVAAARKAGITVILDLQPGRGDALDQAKAYESLLRQPHVGLAIDPEWKLGPRGRPLQRIGHMSVGEINRVSAWLATLTRKHTLPQKLFVVHQFQTQMVRDRDRLVTRRPELATVIHVDGQGPTGAKHGTWHLIRKDAPPHVHWGWKNFVDEDDPMLTAAQTWRQVRPHPDLITYQ